MRDKKTGECEGAGSSMLVRWDQPQEPNELWTKQRRATEAACLSIPVLSHKGHRGLNSVPVSHISLGSTQAVTREYFCNASLAAVTGRRGYDAFITR